MFLKIEKLMYKIARFLLMAMFATLITQAHCSETDFYTVWLPGLHHGHGMNSSLLTTLRYTIYDVVTPASQADLGQDICIQDLTRQLHDDQCFQHSTKIIIIGSSQGAATWLNKIAQMSQAEQEKIVAIILEAPLAHTYDAIMQSAKKITGLSYAPFVRFWSPWIAKLRHPLYQPYGIQAIESVKNILTHIPIIILHNKQDKRISVNSARRLVCEFLKHRPHNANNVYYIESDIHAQHGDSHTDFLYEDSQNRQAFHAILKKLGLPYDKQQAQQFNGNGLESLQPSRKQLEQEIIDDTWHSNAIRNAIDGVTLISIMVLLYWLVNRRLSSSST